MILTQDTPAATCLRYTPRAHVSHHGCVSGALGDLHDRWSMLLCWDLNCQPSLLKETCVFKHPSNFFSFIYPSICHSPTSFISLSTLSNSCLFLSYSCSPNPIFVHFSVHRDLFSSAVCWYFHLIRGFPFLLSFSHFCVQPLKCPSVASSADSQTFHLVFLCLLFHWYSMLQ